jgi:hypothetical protein
MVIMCDMGSDPPEIWEPLLKRKFGEVIDTKLMVQHPIC